MEVHTIWFSKFTTVKSFAALTVLNSLHIINTYRIKNIYY